MAWSDHVNPTPSNPWDNLSQDDVLLHWQELQIALAKAKESEMEFRKYIVKRAFPQATEGVNKVELKNGYELKAGVKYNYRLDNDNAKIEAALNRMASLGNEGSFIADRLISWKPTLSLKEYRELAPQYKKIIDDVVTLDDAAPTLEIKPPKGKK